MVIDNEWVQEARDSSRIHRTASMIGKRVCVAFLVHLML